MFLSCGIILLPLKEIVYWGNRLLGGVSTVILFKSNIHAVVHPFTGTSLPSTNNTVSYYFP